MWPLLLILMVLNAVYCVEKCRVKIVNQNIYSLFTVHGHTLQNEIIIMKITPHSNTTEACFIEEDEFLISQVNKTSPRILIIKMVCADSDIPLTVDIVPGSMAPMPEVIGYLETGCRLLMDDFDRLTQLMDLKVLNLIGQSDLVLNTSLNECSSLSGVGSLSVLNTGVTPANVTSLLSCDVRNVVEVIFQNMSLSAIDGFQTLMPNLQALDLTYNNFTRPPFFPWNNHTVDLPRNLSRNSIFHSHYTFSGTMDIPVNVYRRELKLSHNVNLNLTNFQFHGWIDKLSLSGCNLKDLSSNVFSNVERLQYLQLGGNKLHSLPSDVFHSLTNLRKLELNSNNFTSFHDDTFSYLRELVILNLSNNSIKFLQGGIFRDLQNLNTLYLQDNDLRFINQSAFQGINTKLKELHLQSNPISQFPEVVFLLRGLQRAYLTKSSITEINFDKIESDTRWSDLVSSLADSLSTGTPNLDDVKGEPRVIFLSGSRITSFVFSAIDGYKSYYKLSLLLKHFKIVLDNNPITCDCNILNLTRAVGGLMANGTLTGKEYMFNNWFCSYPKDLEGRRLFSVAPKETYCELDLVHCPKMCKCYRRSVIGTIIVDCRRKGLLTMPKYLPSGKLELWFQSNSIEEFDAGVHNKDVVSLLLSENIIHEIDREILWQMRSLRTLYLDNNLLATLPNVIRRLQLTSLKVGGNPLKCDCHALWMKRWIVSSDRIIEDPANIKCVNSVSDEGIHVSLVPDEDFVCGTSLKAIIIPIAIPTCLILLLLSLCLALFVIWQDFKVWLFVNTGLHPFDQKDVLQNCQYDVFVFYMSSLVDWVQDQITEPLETIHGLKLFDMHRDSRIGVSYQENIQHAVLSSKRILFIVTEDSDVEADTIARTTLNAALAKRRDQKSNFLLPVIHRCSPKNIPNKSLRNYIKAKRYVNTQETSFLKRILYYLPQNRSVSSVCVIYPNSLSVKAVDQPNGQATGCLSQKDLHSQNNCHSQNDSPVSSRSVQLSVSSHVTRPNVFVWYAYADFRFTMENVVTPYEKVGYSCILADRHFVPGAAIQENILNAVHSSFRTVIVLSEASARDEWLLFAFRFAYERQIKERTFLIGLLVRDEPELDVLDDEVRKHLESHVSVRECDRWFREKLITFLKPCDTSGISSDESAFRVEHDCDGTFNNRPTDIMSLGFVSHL